MFLPNRWFVLLNIARARQSKQASRDRLIDAGVYSERGTWRVEGGEVGREVSRTISVLVRARCRGRWAGFCSCVARAEVSVSGYDWVRFGWGVDARRGEGGRDVCRGEVGVEEAYLGP